MPRFELKTGEGRTAEESNNVQKHLWEGMPAASGVSPPVFSKRRFTAATLLAKPHKDAGDAAAHPLPFLPMRRARRSGAAERRFRHRFPDCPMAARCACRFTKIVLRLHGRFKELAAECRQNRFFE